MPLDFEKEAMKQALASLMKALPEGTCLQVIAIKPQVGFGDDTAGLVRAIVIADRNEDLTRFGQILEKGIAAAGNEYGLVDHFLRNEPVAESKIKRPVFPG